ncbi:uncharacterized protein [Nicotiana tomentosiformis]|uniref:uncharacterized protein isoform X1 n=1 Tax=Nicotiana tomentosiformis TaxID=4098 RepID=UPI00051C3A7A|nr:protein seele isoform X1 [Nicotiana tomentosiformis]
MAIKPYMRLILIVAIAFLSVLPATLCIEDKCAACTAIAEELEHGLLKEKPRNHLDMRHRLDSKGQREGKLIDYRASELRVVELLEDLCEKMQDYTLEKVDSSTKTWIKVNNWDLLKTNKQEARAHSKAISSFCGRLLEQTEDDFAELMKKGSVQVGDVGKVLCEDLSNYCNGKSSSNKTVGDENEDTDREL